MPEKPSPAQTTVNNDNSRVTINNYYQQGPAPVYRPPIQVSASAVESKKSKIIALVLCVLFGFFGAHQFYVGRFRLGVLYLFTMGLFGIGWIVDIIRIATGAFRDAEGFLLE